MFAEEVRYLYNISIEVPCFEELFDMYKTEVMLEKFPPFRHFSKDQMRDFLNESFFRKYNKGQVLFMKGDLRDRIYFLQKGYVRLIDTNKDGTDQFYVYVKPASMFPYIGLFKDRFYRFSAEAVTDLELFYIPTARLEKLLQKNPLGLVNIIRVMGEKMYGHEVRMQKITQVHASDRVRQLISFLMKDLGEKANASTIHIPCPITTAELARMSGTTRETVSHLMQEYKTLGKIEVQSKMITVKDPQFFQV